MGRGNHCFIQVVVCITGSLGRQLPIRDGENVVRRAGIEPATNGLSPTTSGAPRLRRGIICPMVTSGD